MRIEEIDRQPCSVARAVAQIGDAWSVLIVREAFYGRNRFSDLVEFTGAQKTVVSARVKQLVEVGILERVLYSEHPVRHRYELTGKGRELAPILFTLSEWGDKWASGEAGQHVVLTHDECGHQVDATVVCGTCGEQLTADNVTPGAGPAYPEHLRHLLADVGTE